MYTFQLTWFQDYHLDSFIDFFRTAIENYQLCLRKIMISEFITLLFQDLIGKQNDPPPPLLGSGVCVCVSRGEAERRKNN